MMKDEQDAKEPSKDQMDWGWSQVGWGEKSSKISDKLVLSKFPQVEGRKFPGSFAWGRVRCMWIEWGTEDSSI